MAKGTLTGRSAKDYHLINLMISMDYLACRIIHTKNAAHDRAEMSLAIELSGLRAFSCPLILQKNPLPSPQSHPPSKKRRGKFDVISTHYTQPCTAALSLVHVFPGTAAAKVGGNGILVGPS